MTLPNLASLSLDRRCPPCTVPTGVTVPGEEDCVRADADVDTNCERLAAWRRFRATYKLLHGQGGADADYSSIECAICQLPIGGPYNETPACIREQNDGTWTLRQVDIPFVFQRGPRSIVRIQYLPRRTGAGGVVVPGVCHYYHTACIYNTIMGPPNEYDDEDVPIWKNPETRQPFSPEFLLNMVEEVKGLLPVPNIMLRRLELLDAASVDGSHRSGSNRSVLVDDEDDEGGPAVFPRRLVLFTGTENEVQRVRFPYVNVDAPLLTATSHAESMEIQRRVSVYPPEDVDGDTLSALRAVLPAEVQNYMNLFASSVLKDRYEASAMLRSDDPFSYACEYQAPGVWEYAIYYSDTIQPFRFLMNTFKTLSERTGGLWGDVEGLRLRQQDTELMLTGAEFARVAASVDPARIIANVTPLGLVCQRIRRVFDNPEEYASNEGFVTTGFEILEYILNEAQLGNMFGTGRRCYDTSVFLRQGSGAGSRDILAFPATSDEGTYGWTPFQILYGADDTWLRTFVGYTGTRTDEGPRPHLRALKMLWQDGHYEVRIQDVHTMAKYLDHKTMFAIMRIRPTGLEISRLLVGAADGARRFRTAAYTSHRRRLRGALEVILDAMQHAWKMSQRGSTHPALPRQRVSAEEQDIQIDLAIFLFSLLCAGIIRVGGGRFGQEDELGDDLQSQQTLDDLLLNLTPEGLDRPMAFLPAGMGMLHDTAIGLSQLARFTPRARDRVFWAGDSGMRVLDVVDPAVVYALRYRFVIPIYNKLNARHHGNYGYWMPAIDAEGWPPVEIQV